MIKKRGRLLLITLFAALLVLGVLSSAMGQSLELTVDPGVATANSVWNLKAVWKESTGKWPIGQQFSGSMPPLYTDGVIDYGVDPVTGEDTVTIGSIRPEANDDFPTLHSPVGFVGFSGSRAGELYQPIGWVWVQPDPDRTIAFETSSNADNEARFNHTLDFMQSEGEYVLTLEAPQPPADPIEVKVDKTATGTDEGSLIAGFIPKQEARDADEDGKGGRPETPAIIVPRWSITWLVGVYSDAEHITPINGIELAWADELAPADPGIGFEGWPHVRVIKLPQELKGIETAYLSYYYPGTTYVATKQYPLPMPYTAYKFSPPEQGFTSLKINPDILKFDPNRTNPYGYDFSNFANPGLASNDNPLKTISTSQDLTEGNFWQYFGINDDNDFEIYLTGLLPDGAYEDSSNVWIRVSVRATPAANNKVNLENNKLLSTVTGVYLTPDLSGTNYYNSFFTYTPGSFSVDTYALPAGTTEVYVVGMQLGKPTSQITACFHPDQNITATDIEHINRVAGVYLDQNATGTNFFVPFEPENARHPEYAIINFPLIKVPSIPDYPADTPMMQFTWVGIDALYFKVSTYAVDGVYAAPSKDGANYYNQNSPDAAYDSKQGLLRLSTPYPTLPAVNSWGARVVGNRVYVTYRPLSRNIITVNNPRPAAVYDSTDDIRGIIPVPDDPDYKYSANKNVTGRNKIILDAENTLPAGTYAALIRYYCAQLDTSDTGCVWVDGVPMYYVEGVPKSGVTYRVAVSAGLNMSNIAQQPSRDWLHNNPTTNNRLIYDPRGNPMWYMPNLVPHPNGAARSITLTARCVYIDNSGRPVIVTSDAGATIHDSHGKSNMIDYGGAAGGVDWLSCYPDTNGGSWPSDADVDPLTVEPAEDVSLSSPDDGSSSNTYTFRVRYHNKDGLPPLPWMHGDSDPQSFGGKASGVVLYLDKNGVGDYRPYFMQPEDTSSKLGVYFYRFIPQNATGTRGSIAEYPYPFRIGRSDYYGTYFDNTTYQSLACGTYHFFFACSDDSLQFDNQSFVFENQSADGRIEWGQQVAYPYSVSWPARNSTGLDPSLPRLVSGYSAVNRQAKRRYTADNTNPFDYTLYVDRPVRVPGYFERNRDYVPIDLMKAEFHPRITCSLSMPSYDSKGLRYDDLSYGFGRFMGTISPYKRAVNPLLPGAFSYTTDAQRAESCGVTTSTDITFRIFWTQIDNKPPAEIKVYINNASEKTGNSAGHTYTAYTMTPSAGQKTPYNYRTGVWYEYVTKLTAGPHTYYFKANDGEHTVRFPVRPDQNEYSGLTYNDWWVPNDTLESARYTADYVDNDYCPGPYVNNPCVLSNGKVDPQTGKEGDHYTFSVIYSDPDGQRPYSAYVYIKTADDQDAKAFAMTPETPFTDPTANHSAEYKSGVKYVFDAATAKDIAMAKGVRRFRFEFKDDWGRQSDVNDRVEGQLTKYPVNGSWIDGPVISGNIPPTLSNGSVSSEDGTSNISTLWTYRVNYRDLNNDKPSLIKVYIGELQNDGKTILWDQGHALIEDDSADKVYTDGKSYSFQTRLAGVDAVAESSTQPVPKQYYYAFEAFDGTDWASYNSSSSDEKRSNAAGCMILQDLSQVDASDYQNYRVVPRVAQSGLTANAVGGKYTSVKPSMPDAIVKIFGIYLTENLSNDTTNSTNYYDAASDAKVFTAGRDSSIVLTDALANGTKVTIRYVSVKKTIKAQSGTVGNVGAVDPSDVSDIERVLGVYLESEYSVSGILAKNHYRPYEIISVNPGIPTTASLVWIEYEADSPIVGPLPVNLPAPTGVIPDIQVYEDYEKFRDPILIDDQKNGWISADDLSERAVISMPGAAEYEGMPSNLHVVPDSAASIASVEGVYKNINLTGLNYAQTQIWERDTSDATGKTIKPKSTAQLGRIKKVYGVYTTPDMTDMNLYNPLGNDGFATATLKLNSPSTAAFVNPADAFNVESVVGVYGSKPDTYNAASELMNYYNTEHVSVQVGTVNMAVLPSNPGAIQSVLGVYLHENLSGTNYYIPGVAPAYKQGDKYIYPSTPVPSNAPQVFISYKTATGSAGIQSGMLEGATVTINDGLPVKIVRGVYLSGSFDSVTSKWTVSGDNYYVPAAADSLYGQGTRTVALTKPVPQELGIAVAYVEYEDQGFGFANRGNLISLQQAPNPLIGSMYLGYFRGGTPNNGKIVLSQPLPGGVNNVYVHVSSDGFNCGDSIIRLAEEFYDENGEVSADRTVTPSNASEIGNVIGVYINRAASADSSNNMYSGKESPFTAGDKVIRLKASLKNPPAVGTKGIYIVYAPKEVYIKYNDLRYTHTVRGFASQTANGVDHNTGTTHFTPDTYNSAYFDTFEVPHVNVNIKTNLNSSYSVDSRSDAVNSGILGVWDSEGLVNYFNPKNSVRYSMDPMHLYLTNQTPKGTEFLWAKYYQRGEYHIDRWNRNLKFLTPRKTDTPIQASYFFGTRMPTLIGANTPPELTNGSVSPIKGSKTTTYVYTVTYRDQDGPNGQAPEYVRVYIDGKPYDMSPTTTGTPAYKEGAVYSYSMTSFTSGAHKFRFVASDGASFAWFDANGSHRSLVGTDVKAVVDIDGPWINDPPTLTAGYASPNPIPGSITTTDSVDYYVTYKDPDNDAPYVYDPTKDIVDYDSDNDGILDGIKYSGSPRLWVDSSAIDQIVGGTVEALEDDPMEAGKKRTIVVAGNPGWGADQFAGKLMQITNGTLKNTVYLIQSNTANKLVISTNDLSTDGVVAGGTKASKFVINGLLMSPADPTKTDYTAGIVYKITVPKLAVGMHKFHFTARSREDKPQWLINSLAVNKKVPYSDLVRFPATGDAQGPNVVSTPPTGNQQPAIKNTSETSIYLGPKYQLGSVDSVNDVRAVDATAFATIREVRGVFINANDFELTAVGGRDEIAKSYYDPRSATPAFASGDAKVSLTSDLPSAPDSTLVQFGTVKTDSLTLVTPDKASIIGSVDGVFLTTDPVLNGKNFYSAKNTDGTITLSEPLPSGTKRVFIKYQAVSGSDWNNVPVYIKYFGTAPATYKANDLVTFRINYSDPDGDMPGYHDMVQGYVKLVFNDINETRLMQLLNPLSISEKVDYKTDVAFTTEPLNLPEGTHKYHFEASDGYHTVRYPASPTVGLPTANDYTISVNYRPVVSSANVDPATGQVGTAFTFTAMCYDKDASSTEAPRVIARITNMNTKKETYFELNPPSGTQDYSKEVTFKKTIIPSSLSEPLTSGTYSVVFEATDVDGEHGESYPQSGKAAITFTIRDSNTPPEVSAGSVVNKNTGKITGKLTDYFIYKAMYKDADGDPPVGAQRDMLTVIVDKGLPGEFRLNMTKVPTAPVDPTAADYIKGIEYQTTELVTGRRLKAGKHTYEIVASDGTLNAIPFKGNGPILLVPYFENIRFVDASEVRPELAAGLTSAAVGDEVFIMGDIKFQDNPDSSAPLHIDSIDVKVTKPDLTTVPLQAAATPKEEYVTLENGSKVRVGWTAPIVIDYSGQKSVDPALATGTDITLVSSGDWTVSVSWAGNTSWESANNIGIEPRLTVGGPMRTIAVADPTAPNTSVPVVDMITAPKIISYSDPGKIFGYSRAVDMRIVRWDPASKSYRTYGTSGAFPALKSGEAVWIKPFATYPAESITQTQVESGVLALGNPSFAPNYAKKYRLIKASVRDYVRDNATGKINNCTIQLYTGWNQVGNIFYNWKKDSNGEEIWPRKDVGIPISEIKVQYLGETKSLTDAAIAGWIRDYAWRYDADGRKYVQVHRSAGGAERVLTAWSGYWVKALVDCRLIIDPNTSYNGGALSTMETKSGASVQEFDLPPPIPE